MQIISESAHWQRKAKQYEEQARIRGWESSWRFVGSGISRPTPQRQIAPAPATSAAPKSDKWRAELDAEYGKPTVDASLFRLGEFDGQPVNAQKQKAVATHEICHAILAAHHGARVTDVVATLDRSGYFNYDDGSSAFDITTHGGLLRWASCMLAGLVGEEIAFGSRQSNDATDDSDEAKVAKFVNVVFFNDPAGKAKFYSEAQALARKVLTERWSDVERIAAVLQAKHRLSGEEFHRLLGTTATQVRRELLPLMTRAATVRAAGGDEYEVIFSTGAAVTRTDAYGERYSEELVMTSAAVDLTRLNAGAPLLASHDSSSLASIIGVVSDARIENAIGLARIRLSQRPEVAGIVQDVRDGVLCNVSVGYKVVSAERINRAGDIPTLRVTKWQPMELSLVAIPADPAARVKANAPTFEAMVAA